MPRDGGTLAQTHSGHTQAVDLSAIRIPKATRLLASATRADHALVWQRLSIREQADEPHEVVPRPLPRASCRRSGSRSRRWFSRACELVPIAPSLAVRAQFARHDWRTAERAEVT